jgi:GNAT superfamily N-acetyltransferase
VHEFSVRRATTSDAHALGLLRWRLKAEDSALLSVSIEDFVAECSAWFTARLSADWALWVAEGHGELLGQVCLQIVEKVPSPEPSARALGYVTNFYVTPPARDRGVGGRLLAEMRAWAEAQQLDTLIVWPSERAVSVYERAGFQGRNEVMELRIS